jgi:NTF2 fold immunity protein
MRTLFVLAYFVFALSLRAHAADEQTVTVKNVSIAKDDVSVKAELQGKSIHLWCSTSSPFCAEPASGEYSMVRAVTADDAIYQDCTDVVLFKSSGVTKEKVGVYCWLDSGDCYMSCGSPLNVETIPLPLLMRKTVEFPTAEPARPDMDAAGYVPDSATAIRLAEARLEEELGRKKTRSLRPFTATLYEEVWTVTRRCKKGWCVGVNPTVRILQRDGRVIFNQSTYLK